jgi:hypothetical protein
MSSETKTVVYYDLTDGHAYVARVTYTSGHAEPTSETLAVLGKHSTLPSAVGAARHAGHKIDGWVNPAHGVMLDVEAIR